MVPLELGGTLLAKVMVAAPWPRNCVVVTVPGLAVPPCTSNADSLAMPKLPGPSILAPESA